MYLPDIDEAFETTADLDDETLAAVGAIFDAMS
jgi:hypothetical protein